MLSKTHAQASVFWPLYSGKLIYPVPFSWRAKCFLFSNIIRATLLFQLESLTIPFVPVEDLPANLSEEFDIIIDAMFGFSFHGMCMLSNILS